MGYETKLYIVTKSNKTITNFYGEKIDMGREINGKKMYYAECICQFDLSKCYSVSDVMREYPPTDCFIYADDGNTMIIEDMYGSPLTEIPIEDAIDIIEEALDEEYYRRYVPILAALKALNADKEHWRELVVLHYGY